VQFLTVRNDCKKRSLILSVAALMVVVALRSGGVLEGVEWVRTAADALVVPSSLAVIAISFAVSGIGRGRLGGSTPEGQSLVTRAGSDRQGH
jgi:hypothetical protein